jgi:HK97 family phage major capsid protein
MKKNPLLIERTNANKGKIRHAKRILFLAMSLLFIIGFITTLSATDQIGISIAGGISICLLAPFAAGVKGEGESDADFEARKGKPESDEAYAKRYLRFLESEIKACKDSPELKNELRDLKEKIEKMKGDSELMAKMKEEIGKANAAIEALKESGKIGEDRPQSVAAQLKVWAKQNETAIKHIRLGQKADLTPLTLKLNSPMTPSNTYNLSAYLPQPEFAPGATEIVRVEPTLWNTLKKGRTGAAAYVWVNKKNPEGAAGFIGPGVAKPGVSFEIATEISNAKKIAVSEKCATELLEDIEGMASWIEQEIKYQLDAKLNTELMTGTVSSTVPAGIQTLSVAYSLTTVKTASPNNWDALIAAVAQLRSGNLKGPVTAFVNPIDYANMILTKATSQGQLFVPAQTGVTIVEDNNVAVGFVQVALLDYYKVLIYKDFQITFGWENDDFTKNLVTAIGEMRIHQFFSENHTGAFIYDELADIKAAIDEAP